MVYLVDALGGLAQLVVDIVEGALQERLPGACVLVDDDVYALGYDADVDLGRVCLGVAVVVYDAWIGALDGELAAFEGVYMGVVVDVVVDELEGYLCAFQGVEGLDDGDVHEPV